MQIPKRKSQGENRNVDLCRVFMWARPFFSRIAWLKRKAQNRNVDLWYICVYFCDPSLTGDEAERHNIFVSRYKIEATRG